MRIAFVGKGGSGKSVIAGTLARLLAAQGRPVLAVDSDPLPGLAFSVGVPQRDAGTLDDAVVDRGEGERPRYAFPEDASAEDLVARHAITGPDGLRYVQVGKAAPGGRVAPRSAMAYRLVVDALPPDRWDVVGDLPGGTRQPFFGWAGFADLVLVVVEPTAASALSARRLTRLARAQDAPRIAAVASKVRADDDAGRLAERTGLEVLAAVPADPAVGAADRAGVPLVDHDPTSPAVEAVASLARALAEATGSRQGARR